MNTKHVQDLTRAADNALRLLQQITHHLDGRPAARELARDAAGQLRHALQAMTTVQPETPELLDIARRWMAWCNGGVQPIAVRIALEADTRAVLAKASQ